MLLAKIEHKNGLEIGLKKVVFAIIYSIYIHK
jgi:hypothetical protein